MKNDYEGFWYPEVDMGTCIDCGLCESVCPIVNKKQLKINPKLMLVIIKMKNPLGKFIRWTFYFICRKIIDNGGVVLGAKFDDEFNVVHDYVETMKITKT